MRHGCALSVADLLDRIEMGREVMMQYGETSTRMSPDSRYIKRTGPGFRQLVQDGHIMYHNGSLTANELEDYFMQIFLSRKSVKQRDVVVDTGELGARFFSQLLSDEASAFLTVDTHYIRKGGSGNISQYELEYGAQFTSYVAHNGLRVRLVLNPVKDDPKYCYRFHPDNPSYTVDSARMDIYDFGSTNTPGAPQSNMSMIMERGVESYAWVSDLVDKDRGIVNDGSKVSVYQKGITCRREASGSLCVWAVSYTHLRAHET